MDNYCESRTGKNIYIVVLSIISNSKVCIKLKYNYSCI